MSLIAGSVLMAMTPFADAMELPDHDPAPGGIAILAIAGDSAERPMAWFGQHRVMVLGEPRIWYALVGLPFDILPGEYVIRYRAGETTEAVRTFRVVPPPAGERADAVPGDSSAPQSPIDELIAVWRDTEKVDLPLAPPFATGQPPANLPEPAAGFSVTAPGAGTVVAAAGAEQILVIDHGQGLFSVLGPLAETRVQAGEIVTRGMTLGLGTGLTETPATRWRVVMNQSVIDPAYLTAGQRSSSLVSDRQ